MRQTGILLLLTVVSTSGCAMCCGTDDENYAAYGGAWPRVDMRHGRAGSAFSTAVPHSPDIEEVEVWHDDLDAMLGEFLPAGETVLPARQPEISDGELETSWQESDAAGENRRNSPPLVPDF